MDREAIFDSDRMRMEIAASHERSRGYEICPDERSPSQEHLAAADLERRRLLYKDFLDVAIAHINGFYELLRPRDFMMAAVDNEGYILYMAGSEDIRPIRGAQLCSGVPLDRKGMWAPAP